MISAEELKESRIRPGFCLIQPKKRPREVGSLLLSESVDRRQAWGLVVNMGDDANADFEIHDWVVFKRWNGRHFSVGEDDDLVFVRNSDVICVLE